MVSIWKFSVMDENVYVKFMCEFVYRLEECKWNDLSVKIFLFRKKLMTTPKS